MYDLVLVKRAVLCLQIFPRSERNFTSESICNWVFEHHEDVLRWLQPPGTKSRLLERELNKGPALLLFVEHNPLGSSSSPVMQQVSRAGGVHTQDDTDPRLWRAPGFSLRSSDIFHLFSVGRYSSGSCGASPLMIFLSPRLSGWRHCCSLSFLLQPGQECNPQLAVLPVSSACRIR